MPRLRDTFAAAGMSDVTTYINTGNVLFRSAAEPADLAPALEDAIEAEFGFRVPVLVRTGEAIEATARAVPGDWVNDSTMKCDVMFLWDAVHRPDVVDRFAKDGIDHTTYVPGAVIWRVDRRVATKSGMARIVGTELYGHMTIRNVNTVRALADRVVAANG
jgi:uncharacterized protein (DUF1697 family)